MADQRHRATTAVLVAGVVAALTAACGGIPTSGPVHGGATLDGPPPVRVLAAPPRAGSSATDIVRGFLRAQPDLDEDEAVARQYLTGPIVQTWATRPKVIVYPDESTLHFAAGSGGLYTITTPVTATVDEDGVYSTTAPTAKASLVVKLSQVFGQWRISTVDNPQVLWLTSYDIERVFAQVPLYYVAPGSRVLVPDLRWFPQTSGLATVIARAQLAPPPAYLRSAVTTGIPANTRLALDTVPTSGSVASVDLNSTAQQPSSTNRTMLWAQLAASVTATPGVDTVRVLVNGQVLDLPGASVAAGTTASALGYTTDVPVSADPVALSAKAGRSVLTQFAEFDSLQAPGARGVMPVPTVRLRSIARSVDVREFAGVTQAGTQLVRMIDGKTSAVIDGSNLTAPSYDSRHWLWTVSSGPGVTTKVHAALTGPGLAPKDVIASLTSPSAPWLVGREVTALRVSRDGTRALVTSSRHGVWTIDIAGVVRDSQGRPLSLASPLQVGVGLSDVTDATWVDPLTVAVLAKGTDDKEVRPYLVSIGAETSPLPALSDAVGIAAGDGDGSIAVVTSKGQVLSQGGPTGWVAIGAGTDVAFPG
jgi:Lipoprotein LpqB beta-propeller domain/Sporulation and spore germination